MSCIIAVLNCGSFAAESGSRRQSVLAASGGELRLQVPGESNKAPGLTRKRSSTSPVRKSDSQHKYTLPSPLPQGLEMTLWNKSCSTVAFQYQSSCRLNRHAHPRPAASRRP